MALHSIVLTAWVLLLGATVRCFAEEAPKQTFTCTAKTFNECLMEAPCSAWKRLGPKGYKLETKIIFRGNPVEGETIVLSAFRFKDITHRAARVDLKVSGGHLGT